MAHRLSAEFTDGQLYVSVGDTRDEPSTAFEAVGRFLVALGTEESALPDRLEQRVDLYRDLVSDRRDLVVVDNAPGAAYATPLIPGSASCAVLINSRSRFGNSIGQYALNLDRLSPTGAVEMLTSIAGTRRVTEDPEAALEIVKYCGRLPLALRIAGVRLAAKPHWPLWKLAGRLRDEDRRLDELSHGHLDVRASINRSYRSLDPDAHRLLRLAGSKFGLTEVSAWSMAAMMAVSDQTAQQCLEQLFDYHLVAAVPTRAYPEPLRYVVSDLVRLFARERSEVEDSRADIVSSRDRLSEIDPAAAPAPVDSAHHADNGAARAVGEAAAEPGHAGDLVIAIPEEQSSLIAVIEPFRTW